jgi:hypothetical protein
MEWEAVGAVATSAATLVALLLGGSAEWRARKAENRLEADRAARARIEEEHQARRVAAWISAEPKGDDVYTLSGQVLRGTVEVFVSVQNASAEPVWNLVVKVPRVEPEGTEEVAFPIVPPETVIRHRLDWTPPDDYAPVEILFRDNRGSEWTRSDVSPGLVQRALPARP